jgi:hypothetical protein
VFHRGLLQIILNLNQPQGSGPVLQIYYYFVGKLKVNFDVTINQLFFAMTTVEAIKNGIDEAPTRQAHYKAVFVGNHPQM